MPDARVKTGDLFRQNTRWKIIRGGVSKVAISSLFHCTTLVVASLVALLSGCQATFGPRALERTHPAYNAAIITSVNEQMLQNLVRLRYRDVAFFLEIASVTASLSLEGSAQAGASVAIGGDDSVNPSTGITYSDRPTISYVPLRGEDLLKSILSPLKLESILVLTQSGWSISRVFGLCFERLNNLYNAPTASGPTPELEPEYTQFKRLLQLLRSLQNQRLIEIGARHQGGVTDILVKLDAEGGSEVGAINEVYELLQLDHDTDTFKLSSNFLEADGAKWTVRTRSMSSLLYYLSQNVETPTVHKSAGLTTVTSTKTGGVFDWSETPAGDLFKVRAARDRPENAYITTFYRGHWFWIEDTDLQSKSTFMLLRQLFDLQAGQTRYQGPTLTLPVGQ